jgi:hypothetical protein
MSGGVTGVKDDLQYVRDKERPRQWQVIKAAKAGFDRGQCERAVTPTIIQCYSTVSGVPTSKSNG